MHLRKIQSTKEMYQSASETILILYQSPILALSQSGEKQGSMVGITDGVGI